MLNTIILLSTVLTLECQFRVRTMNELGIRLEGILSLLLKGVGIGALFAFRTLLAEPLRTLPACRNHGAYPG